MNRGASFLVAPQNLTFDKRAIQASESNTASVIKNLESILQSHKDAEEKRLQGVSEEIAADMRLNKRSIEVLRTEALLKQVT